MCICIICAYVSLTEKLEYYSRVILTKRINFCGQSINLLDSFIFVARCLLGIFWLITLNLVLMNILAFFVATASYKFIRIT